MPAPTAVALAPAGPAAPIVAPVDRPHPTRRGSSRRPAGVPGTPLRAVDGTAPIPAASTVDASPTAPTGPVTVTISVAPDAPARQRRVLTALRELIQLAGPAAALTGPHPDAGTTPTVGVPGAAPEPAVVLDPLPRVVLVRGTPVDLSRLEYDLLLFLARHPRQVFSRTQLLAQVWGHTRTSVRTIDVHVSRLRTKLGPDSDVITTVYGLGYRLGDEAAVAVVRR